MVSAAEEPNLFTKYFLFSLNVCVWAFGVTAFSIGIWALTEKGSFDNISLASSFPIDPVALMIVLSVFTVGISFAGCVGALRENIMLLQCFSISITLIFIVELIFGILGFAYKDWFHAKFAAFVNKTIRDYRTDPDLQDLIDFTQSYLKCCGGDVGPDDWENNLYFNCSSRVILNGILYTPYEACGVPYSCCNKPEDDFVRDLQCGYSVRKPSFSALDRSLKIYTVGCVDSFEDWLKLNLFSMAGTFIAVAFLQIVPLILAQDMKTNLEAIQISWDEQMEAYEKSEKTYERSQKKIVAAPKKKIQKHKDKSVQVPSESEVSKEPAVYDKSGEYKAPSVQSGDSKRSLNIDELQKLKSKTTMSEKSTMTLDLGVYSIKNRMKRKVAPMASSVPDLGEQSYHSFSSTPRNSIASAPAPTPSKSSASAPNPLKSVTSVSASIPPKNVSSAPASTLPKSVASTPKSVASTPKSVASTPKSIASTPKSIASTPKSIASTPKSIASTPISVASTLKSAPSNKTVSNGDVNPTFSDSDKSKKSKDVSQKSSLKEPLDL